MNEKELLVEMFNKKLIKIWSRDRKEGWKLVSGLWSPFYIQLRNLPSHPHLMKEIGDMLGKKIRGYGVNKLLGIAMAGIPIATAVSLCHNMPMCYTRKNKIEYGEHSLVEGEIEDGDSFIAIDDIVTRFDSKLMAIKQLQMEAERRKCNVECKYVGVVIDRQQGADEIARDYGVKIISLIKFREAIEWLKEYLTDEEYYIIMDYLDNPEKYKRGLPQKRKNG